MTGGTTRPRTKAERSRDVMLEAEMYLKLIPQAEIAKKLNLSEATISRDLALLQKSWRESSLMNINEAKQRELARIDTLEREYWQAWVKSQNVAKSTQEAISGPGGQTVTLESVREQYGDPRFLNGIMSCIQKRCEILGLNAPKRTEGTFEGKMSWAQFIGVAKIPMPGDDEPTATALPVGPLESIIDAAVLEEMDDTEPGTGG